MTQLVTRPPPPPPQEIVRKFKYGNVKKKSEDTYLDNISFCASKFCILVFLLLDTLFVELLIVELLIVTMLVLLILLLTSQNQVWPMGFFDYSYFFYL